MRIVFFARLFWPHGGGVEKHVYKISKELIKQGYKITVITEQYDRKLKSKEIFKDITIYRIPIHKNDRLKKFFIWLWLYKHTYLLKQADVIHCHDVFFWYLPFRFRYPLKKIFTTFHGYEGNHIPAWKAKIMHKIAEKLSYGNICVGKFLEKWYKTKASIITYGAVDRITNEKQTHQDKNLATLFIGRLEEEAGILEYLKAIKLLHDKGIMLKLIVLGDGSQRNEAEQYAKDNMLYVTWKGWVADTDNYIQEAQMVFVSRYLGILEALIRKKQVFALYNNSIKKDYLFMSPFRKYISIIKDPEELSQELIKMTKNKINKENKIHQGYEWANKQTWLNLTNHYKNLWQIS